MILLAQGLESEGLKLFSQWGPLGVCLFFVGLLYWWTVTKAAPAERKDYMQSIDTLMKSHQTQQEADLKDRQTTWNRMADSHKESLLRLSDSFEKRHEEHLENYQLMNTKVDFEFRELRHLINNLRQELGLRQLKPEQLRITNRSENRPEKDNGE